ncbi:MAG: hypothetical protein RMA76_31400 [Deltaproteobacteria bacterium]
MSAQVRLRIESLSDRGRVAIKHTLGLSDEELQRMKLPFEAQAALTSERRTRFEQAASVHTEEARVKYDLCTKHTHLAKDRTCSRCKERTCAACVELTEAGVCPACTKKLRRSGTFRTVRITVLFVIFALVALSTYAQRQAIRSWQRPVRVVIVPLAYDQDAETIAYAKSVPETTYAPVVAFLQAEAERYGVTTSPIVTVEVDRTVSERPPLPPDEPSIIDAIVFSLRLRWYAMGLDTDADIRLFVLYHAPSDGKSVPHSIGLERGHVGIVHAFAGADLEPHNAVVLTHELLHTAGATDKYDERGAPIFPEGYADPSARVQVRAELMAISVPTPRGPRLAQNLQECTVGAVTAAEIGWVKE